jgi:hypothetical protein
LAFFFGALQGCDQFQRNLIKFQKSSPSLGNYIVIARTKNFFVLAEKLPDQPLDPIPDYRVTDLAAHSDANPGSRQCRILPDKQKIPGVNLSSVIG